MLLDREHSKTVYVEYPKALAPTYRGLYIPRDGYDGSDVFTSSDFGTDYIIVSERVRSAFKQFKVSNAEFMAISDVAVLAPDQPNISREHQNSFIQST